VLFSLWHFVLSYHPGTSDFRPQQKAPVLNAGRPLVFFLLLSPISGFSRYPTLIDRAPHPSKTLERSLGTSVPGLMFLFTLARPIPPRPSWLLCPGFLRFLSSDTNECFAQTVFPLPEGLKTALVKFIVECLHRAQSRFTS